MISAVYNSVYYGTVVYSLWSMAPGRYPKITAEKISNAFGWTVTNVCNAIWGPQPISDTTITTISDFATRVKGWPLLNTTGEKIDTFINRKSSAERQTQRTLEAIVAAAETAQFPNYPDIVARKRTFASEVEKMLTPNAEAPSWSDLYGFGAQTVHKFGSPLCGILYLSRWIPFNNFWMWGTTALAGLGGYSYLLLRYAGPDLREAQNTLQPLDDKLIEKIKTQAKQDFSLTHKNGDPDANHAESVTRFVNELKEIGRKKTEEKPVAAPPQKTQVDQPKPADTTPVIVKSEPQKAVPLESAMTSQSKIKVDPIAYANLDRTQITQWSNLITAMLQYHRNLSPEDAIVFLKEHLGVVKSHLTKAIQSEDSTLETELVDFRNSINLAIKKYQDQIDRAKEAERRSKVARRLDESFGESTESVLSWLLGCCRRWTWKKAEAPPKLVTVQNQEPQSPIRVLQSAPPPSTPEQSVLVGDITLSVGRDHANLLRTPFTPKE